MPTIAAATAAPAFAASPLPGLNGWVVITRETVNEGTAFFPDYVCRVSYDGYYGGNSYYNGTRLGLWIWDAQVADVSQPEMIFQLPYAITEWKARSGNSGWSVPQPLPGNPVGGWYQYKTTYTGSYTQATDDQGRPEARLTGRPSFYGYAQGACGNDCRQQITRQVTVKGKLLSFTRAVSFPGCSAVRQRSASPSASENRSALTDVS